MTRRSPRLATSRPLIPNPHVFASRGAPALQGMVAAVAKIAALGCRFLVAGRLVKMDNDEEVFLTLDGILATSALPPSLRGMFIGLSSDEFRVDLSSSQIRAQMAADKGGS